MRIKGKFVKVEHSLHPEEANFISKWYYAFELQMESEMSICLHQEDIHVGENRKHKPYMWVSLILFRKSHNSTLTL